MHHFVLGKCEVYFNNNSQFSDFKEYQHLVDFFHAVQDRGETTGGGRPQSASIWLVLTLETGEGHASLRKLFL